MFNKVVRKSLVIAAGFFWTGVAGYGQGVDATVQVPTAGPGSASVEIPSAQTHMPNSDEDLTMAGESKSAKNVVEQEKPVFWSWIAAVGYTSEYNFRGTDLMPNSDGATQFNAEVTKANFTLGLFGIHQLGNASSKSWSIGESGGSSSTTGFIPAFGQIVTIDRFPRTIQDTFNELDVFLSYKVSLGPIDITVGDIGFFIERGAETFERDFIATPGFIWNPHIVGSHGRSLFLGPFATVQNEVFDRVYLRLSTSKIPHIVPSITYYQTVLSDGSEPESERGVRIHAKPPFPPNFFPPLPYSIPNDERNEALGGYLEGRINGYFPITKWMDFDPSAIISVSFRDRTEPGGSNPADPRFGGHPLTGWNHVQAGAKLPIHLLHLGGSSSAEWAPPNADLYFAPFGNYAYHISNPGPGTERNEWWGGAEFEVTF